MSKKLQAILITSYSAVLILCWDYLLNFGLALNIYYIKSVRKSDYILYGHAIELLFFLPFPFFGLLADLWIGRYKTILIGMVLCFISWIVFGISLIVQSYDHSYMEILVTIFFSGCIIQAAGVACFNANIIQYTIDQLVGASAHELNTVIYLHCLILPVSVMLFGLISCLNPNRSTYFELILFIASGVAVSIVLVSHSFFKHKLENVSLIKNPIKLIVRVLCYARKHKYPENRSALTYWEEEAPSRLDLGKEKYGGPFTEEEVEDVKTVFRMLPIFIVSVGNAISQDFNGFFNSNTLSMTCLQSNNFINAACSFLLFLLYFSFIKVFFLKWLPSMLFSMIIGLFLSLLSVSFKMLSLFDNWYDFVSEILSGISYFLINPVLLEFTIAQSPMHSRGMMVGVWYSSWAIGYMFSSCIRYPFKCQNHYLCSDFYYYLTQAVLLFIILIVFLFLAKHYKYRIRDNEVNIYQIVDGTYQNYLNQEREYNQGYRVTSDHN